MNTDPKASPLLAKSLAGLPPAMRNTRYVPGRAITAEREVTTYNNFYEFGSHKTISPTAQRMPMRPWTVKVEGMVEAPREYGIEDLLARMPLGCLKPAHFLFLPKLQKLGCATWSEFLMRA